MRSRSLSLLAEGPCCLIRSTSIRAGAGYLSVLLKAVISLFPLSCNPSFLSLKILYVKLQSTSWVLLNERGGCISFHLFNSLDACRHWTRWLLACALPSVHHCSSIFMLAFQPITFGCPISLCFSDVKSSK